MKYVQTSLDGNLLFRITSFILYYFITIPFMFVMGKLVYGLRIKGRRNLRGHHRGVIAANHCQYIEPGFSSVVFCPLKLLYSAEENNVTRKDIGWLTRLLRAFGIPDENPMAIAGFVKTALQKNWFVHFYPEGVISWRSQEPGPFLEGVFFFAFLNNVPVFPLTEVLRERPIRKILPLWPPRTMFVIGKPVFPDNFREPGVSRRVQVHRMSEAVHGVIRKTIEEEGGCKTLPERRSPDQPV